MTDDSVNSLVSDLVRKVRAEIWTVEVLIKSERVQQNEFFEQWIDVLDEEEKFKQEQERIIILFLYSLSLTSAIQQRYTFDDCFCNVEAGFRLEWRFDFTLAVCKSYELIIILLLYSYSVAYSLKSLIEKYYLNTSLWGIFP